LVLALPVLLVTVGAGAQSLGEHVSINGFGTWAYGETDSNNYLFGAPDGSYEQISAGLTFIGKPYEDVTIFVQPNFEYSGEELEVELGFAFVDWEIKENLHLRVGRVRHPFGIYTEIYDVGTLRPFLNLPQGMYSSKFVARAYNGLGLNGSLFFDNDWGLEYDIYGGQIDLRSVVRGSEVLESQTTDTFGGRLILRTPVSGLRFGVSAYTGKKMGDSLGGEDPPQQTNYALLGEYLANGWSVRGEYGETKESTGRGFKVAYLEVANMLTEHWQLAGRWDWWGTDLRMEDIGLPPAFAPMGVHEDLAVAINYWINPKTALKIELHQIDGNRFAAPPDFAHAAMAGTLDNKTQLIQLGVDFSF
jgi:hypothetical protein